MANRLLLLPRTGSAAAAVALSKATVNTTTISSCGGIISSSLSPAASPLRHHRASCRQFSAIAATTSSSESRRSRSLNPSSSKQHIIRMASCNASGGKLITVDNMNPNIIKMEYAVRGPLVIRATEIERELKSVRLQECLEWCNWRRYSEYIVCFGRTIRLESNNQPSSRYICERQYF